MLAASYGAETLKNPLVRKERREGTLAARGAYARARGRMGARGGDLLLYADAPNILESGMEMGGGTEFVDMSLFPSEEVLRKYLGVGVSYSVNEQDGFSFASRIHLEGD